MANREEIIEALKKVTEPELKKDIVSLKLIKDLQIGDNEIALTVLVNNPALHYKKRMQEAVEFSIARALGKEWKVKCGIEPLPREKPARKRVLPDVKNIPFRRSPV